MQVLELFQTVKYFSERNIAKYEFETCKIQETRYGGVCYVQNDNAAFSNSSKPNLLKNRDFTKDGLLKIYKKVYF